MNAKPTVWLMAVLMSGAAIAGISVRPPVVPPEPNFLETVPQSFGEWRKLDEPAQIVDPGAEETMRKIYQEWISRSYVDRAGYRIMLSVARTRNQIGIQQAHLPKVCYPAQGFHLLGEVQDDEALTTPYGPISVTRLTMSLGPRTEPITYWLTMNDRVVRTKWDKRIAQIVATFTGESPGGVLFRVSSIDADSERAFAMQQKFVADLMKSIPPDIRTKLSGLTSPRS